MKNTYSIAQRNSIVENHLWCIDVVLQNNEALVKSGRMDKDDLYQQLAMRLIRAVDSFDPEKGPLETHIFAQLRFELLKCKRPYHLFGLTQAPSDFKSSKIISFEALRSLDSSSQRMAA